MGRLRGRAGTLAQWARGGLVVSLVVVMAAASSGALGSTDWAMAAILNTPLYQGGMALTVNSTLDEVDANPGDGVCASAANRCTLRAAVIEANARGGRHTINVPAGTYTRTITGSNETNAATGDLNIRGDITIVGAAATTTIIDANQIDRVIEVGSGAMLTLRNVTVQRGQGTSAGGIYASGSLTLTSVIISNNESSFDGGALTVVSSATISDSTFINNRAPGGNGGAIRAFTSLSILRSTFTGNTAAIGAGIYISSGQLETENSTISGNTATGNGSTSGLGGGIYLDSSFGTSRLTNVTIANNAAPRGSGIYKGSSTLQIRNTIVATNTGSADCFRAGAISSQGNNIDGGTGCGFTATGDRQSTNPILAALADNGGPTRTHALQTGSPAIDGGANTGCPATDQRGIQRPRDGDGNGSTLCDIGAFEAAGALPTPTPVPTPRPTSTPGPDNDDFTDNNSPDNDQGAGTPGQTRLDYVGCPGAVSLYVRSTLGFRVGDSVRFNPGGSNQEDAVLADVNCYGYEDDIWLVAPLKLRHRSGEPVVVLGPGQANTSATVNQPDDTDGRRERPESRRRTEEQRRQSEQTNRSGRDDVYTEGDVSAVDLSKQPPEITILTRDGPQIVQLQCGDQCPTVKVGDYVEVDGTKQNEGLFYADTVTISKR